MLRESEINEVASRLLKQFFELKDFNCANYRRCYNTAKNLLKIAESDVNFKKCKIGDEEILHDDIDKILAEIEKESIRNANTVSKEKILDTCLNQQNLF